MNSPSGVRVKVDAQGRMVLPLSLRSELVAVPGEVLLRRTADGVLISPAEQVGALSVAEDGLPVLTVGRRVGNDEVLAVVDRERAQR